MLLTELSLPPRLCAYDMSRISTTWDAMCCWCFFSAARWLRLLNAALAPLKGACRAFQTEAWALEVTAGCCCSLVGASMLCWGVCVLGNRQLWVTCWLLVVCCWVVVVGLFSEQQMHCKRMSVCLGSVCVGGMRAPAARWVSVGACV